MTAVLDAGALIAIDRRDRQVMAMLSILQGEQTPIRTSASAVAQVWRNGAEQANLARTLTGIAVIDLDLAAAKRIGELLRDSGSSDVVDAHIASLVHTGDSVLTSDPNHLKTLLDTRNVTATIVRV